MLWSQSYKFTLRLSKIEHSLMSDFAKRDNYLLQMLEYQRYLEAAIYCKGETPVIFLKTEVK